MNVRTTFEGVTCEIDQALLLAATARIESVLGDGVVKLVVAGDLEAAIRRRLTAAEAANYMVSRISGAVGAKTIALPDAGCAIVVNAKYLIPGIAEKAGLDVPRVFEHEGWHAALIGREEDSRTGFAHADLDGSRGHYLGQAIVLVEEFRVERALAERGIRTESSSGASIPEVLVEFGHSLREADSLLCEDDVLSAFQIVFGSFNALTTALTYLAADETVFHDSFWMDPELPGWSKFVGRYWEELVRELGHVPSAATAVTAARLDAYAEKIADLLKVWLEAIGYRLEDLPDGGLYFGQVPY
jgi:hypothetical protein